MFYRADGLTRSRLMELTPGEFLENL